MAAKGATKGKGAPKEETKKSYVPPAPKDGAKIPAPAGCAKVKMFPISTGPCPSIMSIPGVEVAAKEEAAATGGGGGEDLGGRRKKKKK